MKKVLVNFVFAAFVSLFTGCVYAQVWTPIGYPRFTDGETLWSSMAIAKNGADTGRIIYVAYEDFANGARASVMKFDGSTWEHVGVAGFSADTVSFVQIAVAPSGTPYVVYQDNGRAGAITVMKFNGTNWENVGSPGFSVGNTNWSCIVVDTNGTPYVFYTDFSVPSVAGILAGGVVKKFNGSSWVNVGTPGFSQGQAIYNSMTIAPDGTIYISYGDGNYATYERVMKFNGSNWVDVGPSSISAGTVSYTSIAVDKMGIPYVAYCDLSLDRNVVVLKYTGASWVNVGLPGFSAAHDIQYTSLALDGKGAPCVVYEDCYCNGSKANAMRFDGSSWVSLGNADFSDGGSGNTSMVISDGIPYVVYGEGIVGGTYIGKATVAKLDTSIGARVKEVADPRGSAILIYPNPIHSLFTLYLYTQQNENTTITITNILGEKIKEISTTSNTDTQIQLDAPLGVYFVSAVTKDGSVNQKVVIE